MHERRTGEAADGAAPIMPTSAQSLPAAFVTRLHAALGATDAAQVLRYLCAPERIGLRVNSLLSAGRDFNGLPPDAQPIPGLDDAFSTTAEARAAVAASTAVQTGQLWLQNPSSLLPVIALAPQPGEEVLDLAAAPGLKTLHIAALMGNQGRIAAVEAVKPRFFRLREVLQRGGVTIAQTYLADGRTIGRKTPGRFDRVLLDAPCSSEARFLRELPDSLRTWSVHKVRDCARKQRGLLASAFAALKPGGRLIYSTCSFAVEENEGAVAWLLARVGGAATLVDWCAPAPCVRRGTTDWQDTQFPAEISRCVRVLPDGLFGGFFLAVIGKAE